MRYFDFFLYIYNIDKKIYIYSFIHLFICYCFWHFILDIFDNLFHPPRERIPGTIALLACYPIFNLNSIEIISFGNVAYGNNHLRRPRWIGKTYTYFLFLIIGGDNFLDFVFFLDILALVLIFLHKNRGPHDVMLVFFIFYSFSRRG